MSTETIIYHPTFLQILHISADALYDILYPHFGETGWWPADSPDEVIIGAVLTQNTSWKNVEMSLNEMKARDIITLEKLANTNPQELGTIIRSSGFFRQKSSRLVAISSAIIETFGNLDNMRKRGTEELQSFLLSQRGIGQETMDCILLYVLEKEEFVVDKYTIRILERIGIQGRTTVKGVKQYISGSFTKGIPGMKNFHGIFVELAKNFCTVNPKCRGCPARKICDYGSRKISD